jgi:hypothetical protein
MALAKEIPCVNEKVKSSSDVKSLAKEFNPWPRRQQQRNHEKTFGLRVSGLTLGLVFQCTAREIPQRLKYANLSQHSSLSAFSRLANKVFHFALYPFPPGVTWAVGICGHGEPMTHTDDSLQATQHHR